jgi:hypothetical protein
MPAGRYQWAPSHGTSAYSVQNAATRLATGTAKFRHITSVLYAICDAACLTENQFQGGNHGLQVPAWPDATLPFWVLSACLNCSKLITPTIRHFQHTHRTTGTNGGLQRPRSGRNSVGSRKSRAKRAKNFLTLTPHFYHFDPIFFMFYSSLYLYIAVRKLLQIVHLIGVHYHVAIYSQL